MSPAVIVGLAAAGLFLLVLYSILKVSGECSERERWMYYGGCRVRKSGPTTPRPNIKPPPQRPRRRVR